MALYNRVYISETMKLLINKLGSMGSTCVVYHTTVIIELDLFFPPSPVSCLHDNEILARFNMIGHYVYHDTISFFFLRKGTMIQVLIPVRFQE